MFGASEIKIKCCRINRLLFANNVVLLIPFKYDFHYALNCFTIARCCTSIKLNVKTCDKLRSLGQILRRN